MTLPSTGTRRLPFQIVIAAASTALGVVLGALLPAAAQAQTYPDKPIKLVVPYPPGGLTDTLARSLADPLARALGQPVIIDNKPGAGTLVGAQFVARSPADGYTLLMATSTTLGVSPALYKNNMIDPVKDFTPITMAATVPFFLVASPDIGVTTVKDVVDYARKQPTPVQYGSAGNGSPHHLAMEMLGKAAELKFEHIPYRGSQLAIPDLITGRFKVMVTDLTPALPHIRSGRIKVIATTAPQRSLLMPDVPTFAEAGFPAVQAVAWQGIVAPAGTPQAVIDRLYAELSKIVRSDLLKQRCAAMGCDAQNPIAPAEFADYVRSDLQRWVKVVAESGAKID